MNPELELIVSPSKLLEKTSFVGRMKKMHEFNVDQAGLNKELVTMFEKLENKVEDMEKQLIKGGNYVPLVDSLEEKSNESGSDYSASR